MSKKQKRQETAQELAIIRAELGRIGTWLQTLVSVIRDATEWNRANQSLEEGRIFEAGFIPVRDRDGKLFGVFDPTNGILSPHFIDARGERMKAERNSQ